MKMKVQAKKIISRAIFSLLLLPFIMVMATVLVIDNSLAQGVVSGKYFWFYLSMGGIAVSAVGSFLIRRRIVYYSPVDLCVFLFVAMVLSFAWWLREYVFYTKEVLLALLFALYIGFRVFLNQYKHALFFLTLGFMLTGLAEAVWGLRQLYGFEYSQHSLFKLTGSLFNPGPYGGYLAVCFPMAVYYLLSDWRIVRRTYRRYLWPFFLRWGIAALTATFILLALPATMSRSAWVAALGGSLVAVLLFLRQDKYGKQVFERYKKQLRRWGVALLIAAIIAPAGIYFLKKDSADGRLLIWKIGLIHDRYMPFCLGVGMFPHLYGDLQANYFSGDKATEAEKMLAGNPEYAFNEYLQLLLETGLFSFVVFILILIHTFITGIKWKRAGPVSSLSALLLFAFTSYPFSVLPFLVVLVFLIAACSSRQRVIAHTHEVFDRCYFRYREEEVNQNRFYVAILLLLIVPVTAFCLHNRRPTHQAYKEWSKAKLLYQSGLYREAETEYREIYPLLNDQVNFLFEYGRTLHQNGQYKESTAVLTQGTLFSCDPMFYNLIGKNHQALKSSYNAREAYQRAINLIPHRLYPYYLMAKMHIENNATGEARKWAQVVVDKEPKVPSTAVTEMKTEMKKYLEETKDWVAPPPPVKPRYVIEVHYKSKCYYFIE